MRRMNIRLAMTLTVTVALSVGWPVAARATEWWAAPGGTEAGAGTREAPWDITSALGGKHGVKPGDTLWIAAGTYRAPGMVGSMGFAVRLAGSEGAPVKVRARPGERVAIDGGLNVVEPSTYLWIQDLEITVSDPRPAEPVPPDPTYHNTGRPWGGLNVYSGSGCKFINLLIHDNTQGVSWWSGNRDSELYGCVVYNNGWAGTDRGHGHAVYTQNLEGTKTIRDCIFTGGYGYTLHAYGSRRADVDNYRVVGNLFYNAHEALIGGGKPSHHITVLENYLYGVPLRLGYDAPYNEDCEVRNNLLVNGGLTINRFRQVTNEGNIVLGEKDERPAGIRTRLQVNRYDPDRAYASAFNWDGAASVNLKVDGFLKDGDRYRVMDPTRLWGQPITSGIYAGKPIQLPLTGEFAAFVILRDGRK